MPGVLPPVFAASTPATTYPYDLEAAAALLEEAGYPNCEGVPAIDLYVAASAAEELWLPVLQEDLRQLGCTLNIVVEDNSTYWDHIGQDDVDMFWSGWSADYNDPSEVLNYLFLEGRDDTHYNNEEVNELIRAAMVETDEAARTELYQQAHDIIMSESPWIVSSYSKVSWLQKPWVSGYNPSAGGTYKTDLSTVVIDPSLRPS